MTPAISALYTDVNGILPEIILALGTMALMIVGVFSKGGALKPVSVLALILWGSVGYYLWNPVSVETSRYFNDMLIVDSFSRMVKTMVLLGSGAALLIAYADLKGTIMARFEYVVLMSFASLGMLLMISANDLLSLYMGLELSSLSLYVMAAFNRNSNVSSEAGLKYFVLGAISSGLLLFGASLIYGYVGSTQYDVIHATLSAASAPGPMPVVAVFGMVLIISAMAFKIAAVPFHMWTPDVYQGAPTPVTAFFAIAPKLAALALLMRLLSGPFASMAHDWTPVITLMAVASMVVGSFAAIVQTSFKRLLAYSSIGNIGYALIGLAVNTPAGQASILVYMAIYMVTTVATFGIILLMRRDGFSVDKISDLRGLSRSCPVLAYCLAALMFSMSGIPPLAGFFGKLAVFQAAVGAGAYALAVFGVLTSVVSCWYYINIIRVMFFDMPEEGAAPVRVHASLLGMLTVAGCIIAIIGFILMPGTLMTDAANAVLSLTR